MIIQAAAGFQKTQVGEEVARSIRETNISRDQQVGTFSTAADKEKTLAAAESHAAKNARAVATLRRRFLLKFQFCAQC